MKFARRDRLVRHGVHWLLRCASRDYRTLILGAVEYGMRSAARDAREGQAAPADWRQAREAGRG